MKKNLTLLVLAPFLFFSCKKNVLENPEILPAETPALSKALTGTNPDLYLDVIYTASSTQLSINATIFWPDGAPASTDLPTYSILFTISGHTNQSTAQTVSVPITVSGAAYSTTVVASSGTTPKTVTVKAQLTKSFTAIATTTQSLTIIPAINASTQPVDSIATVSLNKPSSFSNQYDIKAFNLNYLVRFPAKKVHFYAFYIPTNDERVSQHIRTMYLGHAVINGPLLSSSSMAPEGGFSFYLPDTYSVSNIRVFISKNEYPETYFMYGLMNVGYETYFIDQCIDDAVLYGIYTRGLNSTNGLFRSWSWPSYTTFAISSMDKMLDTQIYILKARGFLW